MIPPRLALSTTLAAVLLGQLTAQNSEGTGETQKEVEAAEAAKASGEDPGGDVATNPTALTNLVHATVSTRPRRLGPSESGTLVVLLVLQHPAVVLADAGIDLTYESRQGGLDIGPFQVVPAGPGTLETRFKGSPVHDNTVTLEMPVTVGANAIHGDVRVSFQAKLPVTHGGAGTPMGEAQLSVNGQVKVGRPLPKPGLIDGGSTAGGASAGIGDESEVPPPPAVKSAADAPGPTRPEPVAGAMHTSSSADLDRIVLSIDLPDPAFVPLGGECTARARITVPPGLWLSRGDASALRLEVDGAADGLRAEVGAWPPPRQEEFDGKSLAVSGEEIEVPVRLVASDDATAGLRQLAFRLSYQTVGAGDGPSAPKSLAVTAVLPVGMAMTTANPWLFYGAGAVLAVLLAALLLRGLRK